VQISSLSLISTLLECVFGVTTIVEERSLYEGSEMLGDMNFRTGEFDLGLDPGGLYEDDL
jgi:hypothetical protein